jgi:hypothetical protein
MRQDKEYIFKLRQEGKSFREIQKETGVSRATLSTWFKDIVWSKHLSEEHKQKNIGASKERMTRMGMVRRLKLQYQYALVEAEAAKEYEEYKNQSLFWAGLMIYAGEGDKRTKHIIRVSNSEFYIHRIFIDFASTYLKVPKDKFKVGILLYPDLDLSICLTAWKGRLNLEDKQFYKPHLINGKSKKRLQYGIGMSIISSTALKKKLLKWLLLAENEQFGIDAVIV